jgi:hypothetical protein
MSKVKIDLMKEIEAKIARKKQFAKQASRQKTVASWIAEFFTEYEKIKNFDLKSNYNSLTALALHKLNAQLHSLDRKSSVVFKEPEGDTNPIVEIHWSSAFIQKHNCEEVLILDAPSAFFQSAIEEI